MRGVLENSVLYPEQLKLGALLANAEGEPSAAQAISRAGDRRPLGKSAESERRGLVWESPTCAGEQLLDVVVHRARGRSLRSNAVKRPLLVPHGDNAPSSEV